MSLHCEVRVDAGEFELDVAMSASAGEVIAVVGPNGAGKTTLLRALAGLTPMRGRIVVDDDVTARPPEHRSVGWVPQDGALFPHLNARDNVAFGLGGRVGRAAAMQWLDRFGVADLADRRPAQLSGGQAQKVALARALARSPRLLLLDEPLASLDVAAHADVRRTLHTHLADFDGVAMVVTHDAVDAVTLADRVVALAGGRVVQDDRPDVVVRAPRTTWLAELMGSNAFPGTAGGREMSLEGGGAFTLAEPVAAASAALAVVPAHAVALHRERPRGSARNVWPVVVKELIASGSRVRVRCDGAPPVVAEVTTDAVADLHLRGDEEVWASVKATEVTVVLL